MAVHDEPAAPARPFGRVRLPRWHDGVLLVGQDGPEHLRVRHSVAAAFTAERVEGWRPVIRDVADELIDRMVSGGPGAELVDAYCTPLPVLVMGALLGVPERDAERFRRWSDAFALSARTTAEERKEHIEQFAEYIAELFAAGRAAPGNGLIDDLIAAQDGRGGLSEGELACLVMSVIVTCTRTTSNMFGRGLHTLLGGDRFLWRRIVAEPALAPAVVDEALPCGSQGDPRPLRLAAEDCELPYGTAEKGRAVVLSIRSASSRRAGYHEPNAVRLDRSGRWRPMSGRGPYDGLGAHLARAELQVGLSLLAERLPGLRLSAGPTRFRMPESLPVTW
ncbi:cytochrome P450 [Streptomyces canus]|uniref:cytochrome P450 n=1 Tax=Streptomyces canus TaxID=58343 RepID=UPI00380E04E6